MTDHPTPIRRQAILEAAQLVRNKGRKRPGAMINSNNMAKILEAYAEVVKIRNLETRIRLLKEFAEEACRYCYSEFGEVEEIPGYLDDEPD